MIFDYNVIWEAMPLYLGGLLTTLKLLAISLFFGLLAALPLGLMRVSKQPRQRRAWLYTYVIRGTPMLVQLFLIYYGLAQFEAVRESFLWPWLSSATFCACLAFAINTSAYTAEIIAGSLKPRPMARSKRPRPWACRASRCTAHPAAIGPAPGAAAVQQRSDHDAADHQPGVHRHPDRHHRCRAHGQRAVLPAVRGLHHRRRVLPVPDLHPGAPVQDGRAPLAGYLAPRKH
jgi:His/Glu/Gln/Arg/opine family amino acid ABC transporter permease subunit